MVNKIITSFFFVELILAMSIAVYWYSNNIEFHTLKLSTEFMSFLNNTSVQLNQYKFEIPNIPHIPALDDVYIADNPNWWDAILNFFVKFANVFFGFLNGVISVLNFVITLVNYIIQLIEFIALLFYNFFSMVDSLKVQTALTDSVVL